jgi:hypothetical protein
LAVTASKFGVFSGRMASMNALPEASAAAITAARSVLWLHAGFSQRTCFPIPSSRMDCFACSLVGEAM